MRIIFMGTPSFAVPSLQILIDNGYDVVAVITATDSLGGRGGKKLIESPVKLKALEYGIPVLQPTNLKDPNFIEVLRGYHADVQVVVAFRMLPEIVWNMPPKGTFNLHGSLLPKYRGAAPIHHAVINGELETGVTSFKLKHEIDTGDIVIQRKLEILSSDNTGSVHDKMMHLGAQVILETVQMLEKGEVKFMQQDDTAATKAPKIFHETCKINWNQPALIIHNFIRGLAPFPNAWTIINGEECKISSSEIILINDNTSIQTIKTDGKKFLHVKCADGYISILSLQPQGRKSMTIGDYLNGHGNKAITLE